MSLMFKVYRHQLQIQSHAMNFVNYHEIFPLIILDIMFNNPRPMFFHEQINRYFWVSYFDDELTILLQYGDQFQVISMYIFLKFCLQGNENIWYYVSLNDVKTRKILLVRKMRMCSNIFIFSSHDACPLFLFQTR